jgi:tetratricopeptide (TPR) repeat protein
MLVLDNVDNPDFLFRAPDVNEESGSNKRAPRNRIAYLPPCEHGSMLITSRTREATARLTDDCNVITVEPMGEATALALLEKKLGQSGATEDMQKLAAALDYMPLALAQAGAYIKQRGRRYSVRRYLAKLEKSEKSRANLLTSVSKELRRDQEAQDSIILTWQISFDHIRVTRPSAADLLSLMSMYNYQGIPEYLLKARGSGVRPGARATSNFDGAERDSGASSSASADEGSEADDFEDDILMLENFHFISTTFLNTAFEMHRLVQLAARVWLRSHELYQEWARKGIERLDETLPDGEHKNWERCLELYPHVTSILELNEKEDSLSRASVQYKAAWFDWKRGLWSKAEALAAESYKTRKLILGQKDEKTLWTLSIHASVLSRQGKYEAADEANRQVLEVREKVLGKEHPDTLTSRSNLASVLSRQGKYEAAEEANRQVLEVREKVLGKEHPDTLMSRSNLASVLSRQGKYEAADEANRQVLEVSEKVLGKEHPDTLMSRSIHASVLSRQGKYEAAEEANRQVLEVREKVLGKEHPDTLMSRSNLASVLSRQGKYEAAEEANRQVLEVREKVLGKEHPDTLTSRSNLALVLSRQGKYEAAEEANRQVLEVREKVLGKEHPDTLTSRSNLALVLSDQGKYEAADEANRQVLEVREKVLGKEHPDTLISLWCLADLMEQLGRKHDALWLYKRAVTGLSTSLGVRHPHTLHCQGSLERLQR